MKAISTISAVLSLLLLASCEQEMDFPLKPEGGRLYLECFPTNRHDTTYINLTAARPIAEKDPTCELSDISIDFRVNGEPVNTKFHSMVDDTYVYIAVAALETGDEVAVNATAAGYPPISSVTHIPEATSLEMKREIYKYGILRHRFTVHREDDSGEKRYYGIVIIGERHMEITYTDPSKKPETKISRLKSDYKIYSPLTPSDAEVLDYETITIRSVNGTDMVIFEDDGGRTTDFEVLVDLRYNEDMYRNNGPDFKEYRRTIYLVKMFSISPLAYDYLNPKLNESLLFAGLVPPFISHGNVNGGYGLTSGIGCIYSEWLANLPAK